MDALMACSAAVLNLPEPSRWVWALAACSLGATLSAYCGWLQVLLVESKSAACFEPLLLPAGREPLIALRSIASASVVLFWTLLAIYPSAVAPAAFASAVCHLILYYEQGCVLTRRRDRLRFRDRGAATCWRWVLCLVAASGLVGLGYLTLILDPIGVWLILAGIAIWLCPILLAACSLYLALGDARSHPSPQPSDAPAQT
jgi:hypothetical protein